MSDTRQATTSEATRKATQREVAGKRLAIAARLGIAAAAILILSVLPLQAQTETVLYTFTGGFTNGPDGANPGANLLRDASGNLFGTTQTGGTSGDGTVFELVHSNGSYTEKVLYSFRGSTANDGSLPLSDLVMDSSGNLYGTASQGGASDAGIVFELVSLNGSYEEKVLYSFGSKLHDAEGPQAGLVMDSHENLFGTTEVGGASGNGAVFELVNSSGNYTESVIYSFTGGDDGGFSDAALIMDSQGNLYGTSSMGGTSKVGTVFELVNSSGSYTEKVLYSFKGGADGELPISAVVMDTSGNLYGTTLDGGPSAACGTKLGCGTVFKLTLSNGTYTETLLHTFTGVPGGDGGSPLGLVLDSSGNLYGDTEVGGGSTDICAFGCGTVFKLLPSGQSYTETILYTFPAFAGDGLVPDAALVLDSSLNLYGITSSGGFTTTTPPGGGQSACPSGCGIVFEIAPGASGPKFMFTATSGSNQSAIVGNTFAAPLEVTVKDGSGNPPQNPITVTFTATAGAGGASGAFANGTATTSTTTNPSGVAMASVFTANGTAGNYSVAATAPNVTGTASFALTNVAADIPTTTTFTASSTFGGQNLPAGVALVGNPISVKVTVSPASGTAAPTGTVIVTDGGLGDACTPSPTPLTGGTGTCTLTIATFPSGGITSITAAYTPAANSGFLASTSFATAEQVVEGLVPCGAAIPPVTVKQGQFVTRTFTVCLAGNLNLGAVPLAVRALECPKFGVCTVTVTSLGGGVYTVSVKIVTGAHGSGAGSVPVRQPWGRPRSWPPMLFAFGALLTMLMAFQLMRHNRTWSRLSFAVGLFAAIALSGMSACAPNQHLTPAGMYQIEIQVVAGTFTATVPLNVVVTK